MLLRTWPLDGHNNALHVSCLKCLKINFGYDLACQAIWTEPRNPGSEQRTTWAMYASLAWLVHNDPTPITKYSPPCASYIQVTSIAARGGGGSFKRLKLYNSEEHVPIESFVTTLIHWTFFSDDANKVGICWLCRSGQLHVTPSSRWSLPRCHRSVRNDMRLFLRTKQYPVQLRTTKFWKVLPQYYSVLLCKVLLQKVLLQYYKELIQYYKVLLQYYKVQIHWYSVLQSTTPVLLRTTKYYSSTTPVLLRTTKY